MDLGLTETQQMLRNSAREFLERECATSHVREMEQDERGYTPEMWRSLAEQGWLGLVFPEKHGGAGLSFLDLAVLLEETGRYLLPGPFFSTVVLGGMAILDAGSEAQKEGYLRQIVEGQAIATLALLESGARWDSSGVQTTATPDGAGYLLNGVKLFVPDAHVADYLVVVARTGDEGITLFVVPSQTRGVSQTLLKTVASDRQCEVVFEGVQVPETAVLGARDEGWATVQRVLAWGAVGKCAEMVGGAQRVLDMTVEYAKQRVQFGRPIGSFQAVQHHCANMAMDVEGSRHVTYQAAWRLAEGLPSDREVATAKAWVSDAYRRVCALAHQCHGAIGFTREHDLQLYTRRAKAAELVFGDGDLHRESVARLIGL